MQFAPSVLLAAFIAMAPNSPVSHPPVGSLNWAALRAESQAFDMPDAKRFEYGGLITEHNGKIQFVGLRTDHEDDAVLLPSRKEVPPGDILLGTYHTHPCMPRSHYTHLLSPSDVMVAYFYAVPNFMLDECTGDVHVYDPFRDHVRDTGVKVNLRDLACRNVTMLLPTGRIIGNIGKTHPDMDTFVVDPAGDCPK